MASTISLPWRLPLLIPAERAYVLLLLNICRRCHSSSLVLRLHLRPAEAQRNHPRGKLSLPRETRIVGEARKSLKIRNRDSLRERSPLSRLSTQLTFPRQGKFPRTRTRMLHITSHSKRRYLERVPQSSSGQRKGCLLATANYMSVCTFWLGLFHD